MSCQVLGKRSRASLSSFSRSRSPTPGVKSRDASVALEPPSPDPTPNPKRVKICLTAIEHDDNGSNKENIPPDPIPEVTTPAPRRRVARKAAQPSFSLSTPPPTPASVSPLPPSTAGEATTKFTSLHTLARALLRPQAHDEAPLVGREQERTYILDFLAPFLGGKSRANHPTSLYLSGAPGTGKTALVNEVLKSVSAFSSRDLPDMQAADAAVCVVYVNCMALVVKDVMTTVWERCAEELNVPKHRKRGVTIKTDWSERFHQLLKGQKW